MKNRERERDIDSDLVTQLTIPDKLRKLIHDSQIVTWTVLAILALL